MGRAHLYGISKSNYAVVWAHADSGRVWAFLARVKPSGKVVIYGEIFTQEEYLLWFLQAPFWE